MNTQFINMFIVRRLSCARGRGRCYPVLPLFGDSNWSRAPTINKLGQNYAVTERLITEKDETENQNRKQRGRIGERQQSIVGSHIPT